MNKVIIYARVSAEDRNKLGVSIEKLKKDCIEFASKNSYPVSKIFVDNGKSGKHQERPNIQELFVKNDIQLLIATEVIDTLEGDLMRNIGINFAEYKRKVIAAITVVALKT